MNDRVRPLVFENRSKPVRVTDIELVDADAVLNRCQVTMFDGRVIKVVEIVNDRHRLTACHQPLHHVRSNEPGPACHQHSHQVSWYQDPHPPALGFWAGR